MDEEGKFKEVNEKFKGEDDDQFVSPYSNLEKAAVLQEARIFHDPTQVRDSPRKCCTVIGQLLHLTNTGQNLSPTEATDVFFGVTKLFMEDDASLRRMVYLFIKEVSENCSPDDVIIVTSSLTKDMTCDVDLYRANALRVLTRIVDSAMLGAIERYVKQAVVDSSGQVASAALVSATHLSAKGPECAAIVRRWIGEVSEATSSSTEMVQYHALQLLYQIKKHDRLGVSKLVSQYSQRGSLRSPLAAVLLIRYTGKLLQEEITESGEALQSSPNPIVRSGYQFLESSLRHKSEMVVYEAARAICHLPKAEPQDLMPAVSVLQLFLSSPKPAVRFASMKTLAEVARTQPRVVAKCNEDLEALISDANRSIATLAITTLLKTGSENSIDRLLKQISTFLTNISDEYKITVVQSLQQLCLTYPSKHRIVVGFLSNFLREEGGFEFKRTIVQSIVSLIHAVEESTESSLLHLCEFIEDCEFTMLSTQILHLLGDLGPKTAAPARYIRFIYNRVILENASVRAAAISSLAKFASRVPSLRASILPLLDRSLCDEDDETRDRTCVALKVLSQAMEEYPYIEESKDGSEEPIQDEPDPNDPAAYLLVGNMPTSFDRLERGLLLYKNSGAILTDAPLTFDSLPVVEEYVPESTVETADISVEATNGTVAPTVDPSAAFYAVPDLAQFGRVFRCTSAVQMTESETEYVVTCVKHVMEDKRHLVLQFAVQNTVEDQRLENVSVSVDVGDTEYNVVGEMAAESIPYGTSENCWVILECAEEMAALPTVQLLCEMVFVVVATDDTGAEYDRFDEEYPLEDLTLATSDAMARVGPHVNNDFKQSWESLDKTNEVMEKFALRYSGLEEGVKGVIAQLGMQACDNTATLSSTHSKKPHMLHLCGRYLGGAHVMARAQVGLDRQAGGGVLLRIAVRSDDPLLARAVAESIR